MCRALAKVDTTFLFCTYDVSNLPQRYTYRVLQTIQLKLLLLCLWAELVVLGSTKTALKFKYGIQIG